RILLSVFLLCGGWVRLSIESSSRDSLPVRQAQFYLEDPATLVSRAAAYLEDGAGQSLSKGQQLLEGLLEADAGSAERWSALGGAYRPLGQTATAEYCYKRALALSPYSAETPLSLATLYVNT